LHQSQLLAYREAATEALRKWATVEAPLQPMEDHDTESSFVERCVSNAITGSLWPNWRIPTAKVVVSMEIRKRARATYAKYQGEDAVPEDHGNAAAAAAAEQEEQAKDDAAQVSNDEDNTEENGDENDDEGEVDEEDGEMEDEDDDEGQVEGDGAPGKPGNNQGGAKKKKNFKNQNKKKKVVVRKKAVNAKQTVQNRKGQNTRSRRGGRGGAAGSK
jgi:hypothetical protein